MTKWWEFLAIIVFIVWAFGLGFYIDKGITSKRDIVALEARLFQKIEVSFEEDFSMGVLYKQGVCGEPKREIRLAIGIIATYLKKNYGGELVITSMREGEHMFGSLHYDGYAFDFRNRGHNKLGEPWKISKVIVITLLGVGYQVLGEGDHTHVEWDPN